MKSVKTAIANKALANAGLVTLWGGNNFFQHHPQHASILPRTTLRLITGTEDTEAPFADEIYQLDTYSKSSDLNDDIAVQIRATFHDQPMTITARTLTFMQLFLETEIYEEDIQVHHKIQQIRVTTLPTP